MGKLDRVKHKINLRSGGVEIGRGIYGMIPPFQGEGLPDSEYYLS